MRYTVRTRTGRVHLAEQSAPYWLAVCGTVIVHITERAPAVSPSELTGRDDTVCAYCRAIGRAVAFAEASAAEAIADAGRFTLVRGTRHAAIPVPIPAPIP